MQAKQGTSAVSGRGSARDGQELDPFARSRIESKLS